MHITFSKARHPHGFTLVELMVVLSLLAMIAEQQRRHSDIGLHATRSIYKRTLYFRHSHMRAAKRSGGKCALQYAAMTDAATAVRARKTVQKRASRHKIGPAVISCKRNHWRAQAAQMAASCYAFSRAMSDWSSWAPLQRACCSGRPPDRLLEVFAALKLAYAAQALMRAQANCAAAS